MPNQTIYIGADHRGWELKLQLEDFLRSDGYHVVDMGNRHLVEGDDYPDFGYAVAKRVVNDEGSHGIVICGSGAGICIVANKVKGARAAAGHTPEDARQARSDDNTNILCLPGNSMSFDQAVSVVTAWLTTEFSGADRHVRRLQKVAEIENQEFAP